MAASSLYRLAHISDLHLAESPGLGGFSESKGLLSKLGSLLNGFCIRQARPLMSTYEEHYLRALSRALSARSPFVTKPYDYILVTGDIATTGFAEDLGPAKALLSGKPIPGSAHGLGSDALRFLMDRIIVLPGNHDRYWGRLLRPHSNLFESSQNFGSDWSVVAPKHSDKRTKVAVSILRSKEGDTLAIVSADFSYERTPIRVDKMWGCGEALQITIDQMVDTSKILSEDGMAVVWAMHFCPDPARVKRLLRLDRGAKVVEGAKLARIPIIFCGHTHEPNYTGQATFAGKFAGIQLCGAGSACGAGDGERSYLDIELSVSQGKIIKGSVRKMVYAERVHREYQGGFKNRGDFAPSPP